MTTSTNKLTLQAITDMARSVKTYVSGQLYFSGLHDTPTGYLSGYYVRANETGIEYIHPTGVAKELSEHLGAGDGSFTGLQDTPSDYLSGYYLESTATGISYIDPTGLAGKMPCRPGFTESVSNKQGKTLELAQLGYPLSFHVEVSPTGFNICGCPRLQSSLSNFSFFAIWVIPDYLATLLLKVNQWYGTTCEKNP